MRHESPPNAIFIANRQGSSMCTLITGPSPVPRCKHCRTFDDRVGRQHEAAEVSVRFFVPLPKPSYAPVAVEANRDIQPARAEAISARGYWTINRRPRPRRLGPSMLGRFGYGHGGDLFAAACR